jgi:hypothetical protein
MDADDDYEDHDIPRTADEIARRCLALHCVIAASHGVEKGDLVAWLKEDQLWESVSPIEQRFLLNDSPTEKETTNATWRVEAQVGLLWSIGKIPDLGTLSEQCNTAPMVDAIPDLGTSTAGFVESAELRSSELVSEEYEKVYDAHWKARDAVRRNTSAPDGVDLGIVQERHYGFNWLTGYCGQEWDAITTDT